MGQQCCKDTSSTSTGQMAMSDRGELEENGAPTQQKVKRKVAIRRTVQSEEIGLTADDVEARHGAEDPDLEKLCREAEERKAKKAAKAAAKGQPGQRPSFTETAPEEIPRNEDAENAPLATKRSKGRKGTGFVKKADVPTADDGDDEEEDDGSPAQTAPKKRAKDRKGTGFVKKQMLPVEDDEDDEDEDPAPAQKKDMTRCKNRKGTGFVKKQALPIDDDEDED